MSSVVRVTVVVAVVVVVAVAVLVVVWVMICTASLGRAPSMGMVFPALSSRLTLKRTMFMFEDGGVIWIETAPVCPLDALRFHHLYWLNPALLRGPRLVAPAMNPERVADEGVRT